MARSRGHGCRLIYTSWTIFCDATESGLSYLGHIRIHFSRIVFRRPVQLSLNFPRRNGYIVLFLVFGLCIVVGMCKAHIPQSRASWARHRPWRLRAEWCSARQYQPEPAYRARVPGHAWSRECVVRRFDPMEWPLRTTPEQGRGMLWILDIFHVALIQFAGWGICCTLLGYHYCREWMALVQWLAGVSYFTCWGLAERFDACVEG